MRFLPHRQLHSTEMQDNFSAVEEALSEFQVADVVTAAEVKGTKAKKVALKDSTGKIVGYIPIYSE
jgi:hypothetical protein